MIFFLKYIKRLIPKFLKNSLRRAVICYRFPQSQIHNGTNIGLDTFLGEYTVIFPDVTIQFNSKVGAYTYIQSNTVVYNANIGSYCSIARNVTIGLVDHPMYFVSTNPIFYDYDEGLLPRFFTKNSIDKKDILPQTRIDADVWIGQGAMVKAGVTIGVGAIIGAGAMVTKDVAPYTIVAGIPAREIKKRFDETTCKRLLESKWWEFDSKTLERVASLFNDPQSFLKVIECA